MKIIAKILLTILIIPVFLLFMFSINLRFQVLTPNFWMSTFNRGKVYSQISLYLNNKLESTVLAEGGKVGDVKTLSNFLSEESIKRFVEDNLVSFLTYANGRSKEIVVTVPFAATTLPDNYGLNDLGSTSQKMTLSGFLKQFQINGISDSQIQSISKYGYWSWLFTVFSFVLFVIIFGLEYLLTNAGRRLVVPGIGILLSGVVALILSVGGNYMSGEFMMKFVGSANMGTSIAAILLRPLVTNVVQIWTFFGLSGIFLGILLFFIRKPAINKSK